MIRMCVCLFFFCDYIYMISIFFLVLVFRKETLTQLRGAEESHTVKKNFEFVFEFLSTQKKFEKK